MSGVEIGDAFHHLVRRHIVGLLGDVGAGVLLRHIAHLGVVVAINEPAARLNEVDELGKLVFVNLKGGEDIDVVPLDARDDGHMRLVEVELGSAVDGRSEVLVALNHHHLGRFAEAHHHLEALQLGTHHIVRLDAAVLQHVQNHGGSGGLAVTAANHHAGFRLRLLVEVFGIAEYLDAELLRPEQFWIVGAGMHTQHNGVEIGRDALGVPAVAFGQKPIPLKSAAGWVENLVVGACNMIPFLVQGDGQIVHGAAANGYKMYIHKFMNSLIR